MNPEVFKQAQSRGWMVAYDISKLKDHRGLGLQFDFWLPGESKISLSLNDILFSTDFCEKYFPKDCRIPRALCPNNADQKDHMYCMVEMDESERIDFLEKHLEVKEEKTEPQYLVHFTEYPEVPECNYCHGGPVHAFDCKRPKQECKHSSWMDKSSCHCEEDKKMREVIDLALRQIEDSMREIKFRAWYIRGREMLPIENIWIPLDQPRISVNNEKRSIGTYWYNNRYEKQVEIMQYTGLTDKNGKKIYEGDIIEYQTYQGGIVRETISFDRGYFQTETAPIALIPLQAIVVIGNIYENPELLKV